MESGRTENKGLKIAIIIIRVIWIIGYLGMTILSLSIGIRDYSSMKANPDAGHNGLAFVLVLLLVGSIAYGVVTALGLINLILSIINKHSLKRKFNIITSTIGIILPYLTEFLLMFVFGKLF